MYGPDFAGDDYRRPHWIDVEAVAVADRVHGHELMADFRKPQDDGRGQSHLLTFILLTDSHFTYNGTWEDTVASMEAVKCALASKGVSLDGIIHLGDLTDGLLPLAQTAAIEERCIRDMEDVLETGSTVGMLDGQTGTVDHPAIYLLPGNHDYNYFKGNPEIRYPNVPQYYVDKPEAKLRLIFLDSFDPKEQLRYGFTEYAIHWVEAVLNGMPKDYCAIIFSHVPPIKQLHVWSEWIRNSHILMPVLDGYADRILALINGHSHCDHLFNDLKNGQFPIIAINCAKCEYFTEYKPEGAHVPPRRLGDKTQECFDIMQVDTVKREIYFTRFGAGQDRIVRDHRAWWAGE